MLTLIARSRTMTVLDRSAMTAIVRGLIMTVKDSNVSATREVNESPFQQGVDETLTRTLTTTPWGSTPTSVVMTVYDITNAEAPIDVTLTVLSGSTSVASDVITTKKLGSLTLGHKYRMEIRFTDSAANIWEAYAIVNCK